MARTSRPKDCPLCGKPPSLDHAPFCSAGCKDRDLLEWLGDGYRVPGAPADPDAIVPAHNGLDSDS